MQLQTCAFWARDRVREVRIIENRARARARARLWWFEYDDICLFLILMMLVMCYFKDARFRSQDRQRTK